jgi:hypothetical protein
MSAFPSDPTCEIVGGGSHSLAMAGGHSGQLRRFEAIEFCSRIA